MTVDVKFGRAIVTLPETICSPTGAPETMPGKVHDINGIAAELRQICRTIEDKYSERDCLLVTCTVSLLFIAFFSIICKCSG